MSSYLYLLGTITLATVNNLLLHKLGKKGPTGVAAMFRNNGLISLTWVVVLLAFGGASKLVSVTSVIWGVTYGLMIAWQLGSKMLAFSTGPMSIASLIACCSFLIPTFAGIVFWQETVSALQIVGVCLLLASLYLCTSPKAGGEMTLQWKIYCLMYCLSCGAMGLIFKLHQSSSGKAEITGMMLIAACVSSVVLLGLARALRRREKTDVRDDALTRPVAMLLCLCGLAGCVYNRLNIYLSGVIPSVVFFPVFNGSVIVAAAIAGALFFREKPTRIQLSGMALCMLAVLMIGKVF